MNIAYKMSITVLNGYSKRYSSNLKYPSYSKDSVFMTPKVANTFDTPKRKVTLSPIKPISVQSQIKDSKLINSKTRFVGPRYSLSSVIENNSKEYESAISKHLGVNPQSRESHEEDQSPLVKILTQAPQRFKAKNLNLPEKTEQGISEIKIQPNEKFKKLNPIFFQEFVDKTKNRMKVVKETVAGMRGFLNRIKG